MTDRKTEQDRERRVGKPHETSRELVEEGQEREGTNLDIGEERSRQQKEQQKEVRRES